jgi:chemotaxis protein MotB
MRRRVQPGHDNHDRWLVSYADFITLMFAFFVVMFASSQADRSKAKRVSESVTRALEDGPGAKRKTMVLEIQVGPATGQGKEKSAAGASVYQAGARVPTATSAQAAELLPSLEYLSTQLKNEIASGKMRISLEARGLVVSLRQATFFPSGEDTIDPATYASLQKVATAICQLPNPVRLEGHTDAIPIHTARFRSNWDLSAARAIAVLNLLTARFNVPAGRRRICRDHPDCSQRYRRRPRAQPARGHRDTEPAAAHQRARAGKRCGGQARTCAESADIGSTDSKFSCLNVKPSISEPSRTTHRR